jgi:hypothetical protein
MLGYLTREAEIGGYEAASEAQTELDGAVEYTPRRRSSTAPFGGASIAALLQHGRRDSSLHQSDARSSEPGLIIFAA